MKLLPDLLSPQPVSLFRSLIITDLFMTKMYSHHRTGTTRVGVPVLGALFFTRLICMLAALLLFPFSASAAGGTGKSTLPWERPGEVLEYHSCGCADACWVAEVRSITSHVLLARLRCDCEHLYFSVGARGKEESDVHSCSVLDNKPEFIRETLEKRFKK